ncbi:hypothetical protein ABID19_001945 [Mesorhizobium robiniae]|uniref:Uncharacterized protein n=1 Tax=Mesorhizobium robiniae TaxID=559315 RepID=A0ABV2GKU9_9HYPH
MIAHVLLRAGEHSARAAGGIEHPHGYARLAEKIIRIEKKQIDHQRDDLARREVIAGRFVRQFVKAADQVFENQTHVLICHPSGMQIDIAELLYYEIEDVSLLHSLDFVFELEIFKNALDVG